MAPKREKSLLENPPAASSSEDEDVEEEDEEVEEVEEAEEEEEGDEEEEEEEEDDDEEEEEEEDEATTGKPNSSSAVKIPKSDPNPSSGSKPQTPSSDEEEDDESEEESDSEPTPPKLKPLEPSRSSNPSGGKPISSQPKKSVTKPSTSTPTSTKPSTTVKRPLETENDSKRKKKKVDDEDNSNNPEESEKRSTFGPKSIFQRLWSDDDEIVVLRGMIEFKKKGVDPFSDLGGFLDSIKKSLHVVVKIDQLNNKIKRLKKKYLNNYKRGKGDEDPVFSKPHEVLSYELMKEIWGGKEGNIRENNGKDGTNVVANGGKKSSKTKKSNNAATKTLSLSDISMRESSSKVDERNGSLHPCVQEMVQSGNNMVGESFLKEGLGLIGDSKSKDLEKKWRNLYAAELQLYLRRVELVREQTIAILDAHKSSDT